MLISLQCIFDYSLNAFQPHIQKIVLLASFFFSMFKKDKSVINIMHDYVSEKLLQNIAYVESDQDCNHG